MDFNTIYESVKAYIGAGGFATALITIFTVAFKLLSVAKEIKKSFTSTESEALKAFKNAIPKELYVSIESLAKSELNKIVTVIAEIVKSEVLEPIKKNTEITQAVAKALTSMKAIPDSQKEQIIKLLELEDEIKTTESLKVELLPTSENVEVTTQSISVD